MRLRAAPWAPLVTSPPRATSCAAPPRLLHHLSRLFLLRAFLSLFLDTGLSFNGAPHAKSVPNSSPPEETNRDRSPGCAARSVFSRALEASIWVLWSATFFSQCKGDEMEDEL